MSLFDLAKSIYDTVGGLLQSDESRQREEDENRDRNIAEDAERASRDPDHIQIPPDKYPSF